MAEVRPNRSRYQAGALFAVVLGTALCAAPANATITDLTRYCSACWRNARLPIDAWPDATQEVFVRLLERLPADAWDDALQSEGEERRELLRAIDCVKKRVQRTKITGLLPEEGVADVTPLTETVVREDRDAIAKAAAELLTDRQRSILRLWAEGYDVPDIAERIGISKARVSDEKYKAVRKLREELAVEAA